MSRFESFRVWAARAPFAERAGAAVATIFVVSSLTWMGLPQQDDQQVTAFAPGDQSTTPSGDRQVPVGQGSGDEAIGSTVGGTAPVRGETGGDAAPGVSAGGSTTGAGGPSATSSGCPATPGTSPSVTDTEIKIDIFLIEPAGPIGGAALGLPTAGRQRELYETILDDINSKGGAACRQIVATYSTLNPADSNQLQQQCLTVAERGTFAVLDAGNYTVALDLVSCYVKNRIPYFGVSPLTIKLANENYPFMFGTYVADQMLHDTVYALDQLEFFSAQNGFKKLGFLYRDCNPELVTQELGWLREVGLSDSEIVTYNIGCSSAAFATPDVLQQAVLKFQGAGVTHFTTNDSINFTNFTRIAEIQGFRPKYGLADLSSFYVNSSNGPNSNNLKHAIAITNGTSGEPNTPGVQPGPGTARCNEYIGGGTTVYDFYLFGQICNQTRMFAAALDNAPILDPSALAAGLNAAGSVEFAYPQGPNNFSAEGVTFGGQLWRTLGWDTGCSCWKVTDPTFHPSFPGLSLGR